MNNEKWQSQSPGPATVGSILRQRGELRQWGRERGGDGCGNGRGPADGAGRALAQPGVEAGEVEHVPALRHHPQHLAVPVLAEADRAAGLSVRARGGPGEGHPRVRRDDGGVEPDGRGRCVGASGGGARGLVVGDEDDAGHGDRDVAGAGCRGRSVPRGAAEAAATGPATEAEVGGEQHEGEQHEESQSDGDGVPGPERGELIKEGHGSLLHLLLPVGGGGVVIGGQNGMAHGGGAEWEDGICLGALRFPGVRWIWWLAALIAGEGEEGSRDGMGAMARCVGLGEGRGTRETAAEVACVCAGMWAAEEQQQQMRVGPSLTMRRLQPAHGLSPAGRVAAGLSRCSEGKSWQTVGTGSRPC
jgi:hypothetical protein